MDTTTHATITKTAAELEPGDKIVRGHMFPHLFYTGTVKAVVPNDTPYEWLKPYEVKVICEDGQWNSHSADEYTVEA